MVAYPSKGRGARPLLPPFPFPLCNARGRGILLAKNHQDENAIAQTHIRIPTRAHSPASAPRSIASSPRSSRKSPLPSFGAGGEPRARRPRRVGGILRITLRLRHRAGARRCGVRLRGASAQHVTEPRDCLRVGLHERRGAFDAGRAPSSSASSASTYSCGRPISAATCTNARDAGSTGASRARFRNSSPSSGRTSTSSGGAPRRGARRRGSGNQQRARRGGASASP